MVSKKNKNQGPEDAPSSDRIEIRDGDAAEDQEASAPGLDSEADESPEEAGDDLEKACEEARENYDKYLRVCAEFDNYKKRAAREIGDFRKYANETLIKDLLAVVDNLERAVTSIGEDKEASNGIVEGVEMTLKEILKIFERFGVKQVEALGEPFDPSFHQAMMQEASDDHPENTVLKELQKGYILHDRLLRPSMVVVAAAAKKD